MGHLHVFPKRLIWFGVRAVKKIKLILKVRLKTTKNLKSIKPINWTNSNETQKCQFRCLKNFEEKNILMNLHNNKFLNFGRKKYNENWELWKLCPICIWTCLIWIQLLIFVIFTRLLKTCCGVVDCFTQGKILLLLVVLFW